MLAEQSYERAISAPNNILDRRCSDLRKSLLLLDIVEYDGCRRAENQAGSATVEDLVRLDRGLDALDHRV